MAHGLFVTGTDTEVGKTFVAAGLVRALRRRGADVGVMKPVATGCVRKRSSGTLVSADAQVLIEAAECRDPMELVCPVRFEEPLAPMVVSRRSAQPIDVGAIWSAFEALSRAHAYLVVEGIGGILVPIARGFVVADMAKMLGLPVLVVARPSLGTLNHTLLTVEALRARGLSCQGIVLNHAVPPQRTLAEETNEATLREWTGLSVWTIPYQPPPTVFDVIATACDQARPGNTAN